MKTDYPCCSLTSQTNITVSVTSGNIEVSLVSYSLTHKFPLMLYIQWDVIPNFCPYFVVLSDTQLPLHIYSMIKYTYFKNFSESHVRELKCL